MQIANIGLDESRDKIKELDREIVSYLGLRTPLKSDKSLYPFGRLINPFDTFLGRKEAVVASRDGYAAVEHVPFTRGERKAVNVAGRVLRSYFNYLTRFSNGQDTGNQDACFNLDFGCLWNISARVHSGVYVAEAKFQKNRKDFEWVMQVQDTEPVREKLRERLRNISQEEKVIARVEELAQAFGLPPKNASLFYRKFVIPMTLDAEVAYLMQRGTSF